MKVDLSEPRLHYQCIDQGFYLSREFLTLAETTVSALQDSDTGGNMNPDQWHGLWRLLQLLSNTLERIHKDYQAEVSQCQCSQKEDAA